ncbi:MAG TPA: FAD-dependent oxidoreductase [Pseudonocardiaceae bacterium]|jgi:assimilatory nitrate reductase electron transfer subunit|nr:FAD-dependent oxidoreductase [Pseudonocardiaceae bacterium]
MNPHRVVVVGYGMAAARFAEQVRARDPHGDRISLTVLGAERRPAYNRILLSNAISGRLPLDTVLLHRPGWGQQHAVDVRTGVSVLRIDRAGRQVLLDEHSVLEFDTLVLAIGSQPFLPPVDGLRAPDGSLARGVRTFRTLDDCQRIIESAASGTPVAVLGGGLLGLETARGLASRGNRVTVVHAVNRLMDRQLDQPAGAMLAEVLSDHGLTLRLDQLAVRYRPGVGLELADGELVPAGLVVVTTGVRSRTGLARRAGLAVRHGIIVDDELRTSDPNIRAIGDCAEHNGVTTGLVDPAWAQAEVLADLITDAGPTARYRDTPTVTRLKARDVELVALGDTQVAVDASDAEVLCLHDPSGGRYGKLVVRDDRVAGAILIGLPDAGATISQFYDRSLPVPADRLALLLGRVLPELPSRADPGGLPDDEVVCRCNTVTKRQLVDAWRGHDPSLSGLVTATRATTGCNGCRSAVHRIAEWLSGGPVAGPVAPATREGQERSDPVPTPMPNPTPNPMSTAILHPVAD